jgi:hypothetical protein
MLNKIYNYNKKEVVTGIALYLSILSNNLTTTVVNTINVSHCILLEVHYIPCIDLDN